MHKWLLWTCLGVTSYTTITSNTHLVYGFLMGGSNGGIEEGSGFGGTLA